MEKRAIADLTTRYDGLRSRFPLLSLLIRISPSLSLIPNWRFPFKRHSSFPTFRNVSSSSSSPSGCVLCCNKQTKSSAALMRNFKKGENHSAAEAIEGPIFMKESILLYAYVRREERLSVRTFDICLMVNSSSSSVRTLSSMWWRT